MVIDIWCHQCHPLLLDGASAAQFPWAAAAAAGGGAGGGQDHGMVWCLVWYRVVRHGMVSCLVWPALRCSPFKVDQDKAQDRPARARRQECVPASRIGLAD